MARLINNIEDLKRHLTIGSGLDFNKILPHSKRAERKFIESQIGFEQLALITAHTLDQESDLPIDRVKNLLEEAAAHYALFLSMPALATQVTNTGIKTTTTTQSTDASWHQVRDLKRSYIETANEAVDDALEIMEDNATDFPAWKSSDLFTIFKSIIIRQTKTFNMYFDIQKNRKTFLALKPYMIEVEEEFLLPMLKQCTLDFIKEVSIVPEVIRVQELIDRAVVALTVSKAANVGTFIISATSMTVASEEMPWDKSKLELSEEKLARLKSDRQNSGQEYLKKAKKIILEHPIIFNCYTDNVENGLTNKIIQKKSHLFL